MTAKTFTIIFQNISVVIGNYSKWIENGSLCFNASRKQLLLLNCTIYRKNVAVFFSSLLFSKSFKTVTNKNFLDDSALAFVLGYLLCNLRSR